MDATLRQDAQVKIDEMVRRIVELFHPEKIILFGSYASGTAGPDSDVDLLVVMPVAGSRRAKTVEIGVALHDVRMPKDIILATPDEVAKYHDIVGHVIYPALRDGKVLYDHAA